MAANGGRPEEGSTTFSFRCRPSRRPLVEAILARRFPGERDLSVPLREALDDYIVKHLGQAAIADPFQDPSENGTDPLHGRDDSTAAHAPSTQSATDV